MLVVQASLEAGQYGLASELLRFLIPPGDNDILAAMPTHPAASEHANGKLPHTSGAQDAGVRPSFSLHATKDHTQTIIQFSLWMVVCNRKLVHSDHKHLQYCDAMAKLDLPNLYASNVSCRQDEALPGALLFVPVS